MFSKEEAEKKISPVFFLWFFITILGALFVRLHGLSEYAFNDDELWHLTVANQKSFWEVIQYNFTEEIHPPLSYIIWHFMLQVSHNDLWLRMSGIIPGLLLIPSIYYFGRLYLGKIAGYFLALLFAFGALPMSISATIRAYSLLMLALTWAAIFLHQYIFTTTPSSRKKSLIFYSLCALVALELHHASAFVILAFGLAFFTQSLKEKNKKDFLIVAAIHATIALALGAYLYILKTYYNFHGLPHYFLIEDWQEYLKNYLIIFLYFPFDSLSGNVFLNSLSLIALFLFFVTPFFLLKDRKWLLLNLTFTPLFALILADYFGLYPFSFVVRNNLFLFFGVAISYVYLPQKFSDFLLKSCGNKSCEGLKNLIAFAAVFCSIIWVIKQDSFRKEAVSSVEFSIKKSDRQILNEQIQQRNIEGNVFVTVARNLWYWRFYDGDAGNIEIITPNLAKYKNNELEIYFTAFPATRFSITGSMYENQLFFRDLLIHLGKKPVKSFTFFDLGLKVDFLSYLIHPQLIPDKKPSDLSPRHKLDYELGQEAYAMSWAISSSKEVLDRFYFRDPSYAYGREIILFSFTPKFVREEILSQKFVDRSEFKSRGSL